MKGTIFNIQRFSIHDGPGIRTTVFFKGCPLVCRWCHNPEGRSPGIEKLNGKTVGREISVEGLLEEILKDRVFYEESGGGVTFSGGEPLAQPDFLLEMLDLCKGNGIHTTVDTCGFARKVVIQKAKDLTDLFLFDLKLTDPELHRKLTGQSNDTILQNMDYLLLSGKHVIIRIPMIPGITATKENLEQIAQRLALHDPKPAINLLPYHRIAEGKFERYNLKNPMKAVNQIEQINLTSFAAGLHKQGFKATIGG